VNCSNGVHQFGWEATARLPSPVLVFACVLGSSTNYAFRRNRYQPYMDCANRHTFSLPMSRKATKRCGITDWLAQLCKMTKFD
jgi:hypothetical protein